jgi:hypothetical protein
MNWKIARDPYLAPLAARHGERTVWESGFFEDDDQTDAPLDDVHVLCTPLDHVRRALTTAPDATPVVLLSTGAFWPPHAGHLALLERARARAEAAGWWVVGGYLSPGHDAYLRMKWGDRAPPASARLAAVERLVAPTPWIAVDPWEARHRRVAVNYTDVAARLRTYLRHHLRAPVEVAYVCGADNARFALAFAVEGRCVVVGRPGSAGRVAAHREDPRLDPGRVLWADGDHPAASSALSPAPFVPTRGRLQLRLEDGRAVRSLGLPLDKWRGFQASLLDILRQWADVVPVPVAATPAVSGAISLDPWAPGDVNLGVSRRFDLGGRRLLGHAARPGWPPLSEQLAAVPPGAWALHDDDAASGGTLAWIAANLPSTVRITGTRVALRAGEADIADSRDFLVGTDDGGLVLALPDGSHGRAPYLLPFVCPAARGATPPGAERAFSEQVWRLNAALFEGSTLRVADLPAPAARVLAFMGASPDARLAPFCASQAAELARLAPLTADPFERPLPAPAPRAG